MDIESNVKNYIRVQAADELPFDATFYEGSITSVFLPWLVETIPDKEWNKLQNQLKVIISEIKLKAKHV